MKILRTFPLAAAALPALALLIAGCALQDGERYDDRRDDRRDGHRYGQRYDQRDGTRYRRSTTYVAPQPNYVAPRPTHVVVHEHDYPQRVYYREPHDTLNVYYYEAQRPDVVVVRPVLREQDGRTYYVERDGSNTRHVYYDDNAARGRKKPTHGRGPDGRHDNDRDDDDDKDRGNGWGHDKDRR